MGVEVAVLRAGGIVRPGSDAIEPVRSVLLRTSAGLVLFDTGLHPVHVARPDATHGAAGLQARMTDDDGIVRRLAAEGVAPEDIAVVVNSELDFSHAGNNGAFPRATVVVQADHLALARRERERAPVYWDLPSIRFLVVSGDALVAPGVRVIRSPGHLDGRQSLVIERETGSLRLWDGLPD